MNRIFNLLCGILIFLNTNTVISQTKYNLETFSDDAKSFLKQPSNWESEDILIIAGSAGLTFATMYIDEYVREQVLKNDQYRNTIPVEFGRIWGEPLATLFIGGSIYFHGLATNNSANKKIGFEIGESAFFTSIVTAFLKYSFGRERPRENGDAFSFHPFSFQNANFLSLNSGHTALAFSLSTVLAHNTSNSYLKALFYLPAFMTAFSRVYQNHHWTSDVILGGIIGFSIAEFVTSLHKKESSSGKKQVLPEKPMNLIHLKFPL